MKKYFIAALAFAAALTFQPAIAAVKIGEKVADFSVVDANGKTHKLSDFKGKNVVLEWTNHECPFVVKHYETGNMQKLQKEFTAKDVIWLSVISSAKGKQGNVSGEQANEIAKKNNAAATAIIIDEKGELGKMFGAKTTPHMFIIDKEGKLAYMGAIDDKPGKDKEEVAKANNYVAAALNSLLAGKTPEKQITKQYGCSIKY